VDGSIPQWLHEGLHDFALHRCGHDLDHINQVPIVDVVILWHGHPRYIHARVGTVAMFTVLGNRNASFCALAVPQ